jgi:hypothetical protein
MIVYRFRLTSEDHEDFIREIEIQPVQTFLDFHNSIVSCSNLENCENALLYTTDTKFKKKQEFSLKEQKKQVRKYDDDTDQVVTETYIPHLMKKSVLKNYIDDPHQKMIYEFHGKDNFTLFIELYKIIKTDDCYDLPRCVYSKGELPRKVVAPVTQEDKPALKGTPDDKREPVAFVPSEKSMFTEMIEDESEIAEIESNLKEFMDVEKPGKPERIRTPRDPDSDDIVSEIEDEDHDPDEMEGLGDFDDMDNQDTRRNHFDEESDDF